ncbi:MAG: DinB family protein, partial [Flavipsychrobacter sp.]
FLRSADRTTEDSYTVADLKQKWQEVNELLSTHFAKLEPADWLDRHMSVSPEDFAKEPHRNRLNVILGRTNHQASHMGQLNLLHKHALAD